MIEWGEEEMRSAKKSLTREETFVSEAISDECECKGTTKIAHGNGLSPDLWGSCPLTCETAWKNG